MSGLIYGVIEAGLALSALLAITLICIAIVHWLYELAALGSRATRGIGLWALWGIGYALGRSRRWLIAFIYPKKQRHIGTIRATTDITAIAQKSEGGVTTANQLSSILEKHTEPNSIEAISDNSTPILASQKSVSHRAKTGGGFDQNSVPGRLYIACSRHLQPCILKIGQTLETVDRRMTALNKQSHAAEDVAEFTALASLEVSNAWGYEQSLFDLLEPLRISSGREFFIANVETVIAGFRLLDASSLDRAAFTAQLQRPTIPHLPRGCSIPPTSGINSGYLFAIRNPLHRDHLYRWGATSRDPNEIIKRQNLTQRRYSSQIGFYTLVMVEAVADLAAARANCKKTLRPFRYGTRPSFVEIPLAELSNAFRRHGATPSPLMSGTLDPPRRLPRVDAKPNKSNGGHYHGICRDCGSPFSIHEKSGWSGIVTCGECGCIFFGRVQNAAVATWPYRSK